jgi:uncharacterized protein (DUF1697 family)
MTVRIALLRGINLGAHKKVPMAKLRELSADIGLVEPQTYVQSGNLLFDTKLDESTTVDTLENAIQDEFGFDVPVICRTAGEIEAIVASHPFSHLDLDDRRLHVAFLDREPDVAVGEVIDAGAHDPDRFEGDGREIYLAYPAGLGRSKLNHSLLEGKLGVSATLRNWRTVNKLAEMSRSRST